MNFVTRKSFLMKLIISVFLVIFLFNTITAHYTYGAWIDIGGLLFSPISMLGGALLCGINAIIAVFLGGAEDVFEQLGKAIKEKEKAQFREFISKSRAYICRKLCNFRCQYI